jgi:hypothetical protein
MASALSNMFSFDHQRARYESERLEAQGQAGEDPAELVAGSEDPHGEHDEAAVVSETFSGDEEEGGIPAIVATASEEEAEPLADTQAEPVPQIDDISHYHARGTVSLAELEEERELARRRASACVLLAVFVLFRLWIEAITDGDLGLLLLCLVGTSWTARWIRHNREREQELDRRISQFLDNSEPGTTEVDRNDLRMLSFQAQLALAIMESQRQMMQGGYGNPDGDYAASPGVSERARELWDRFQHKEAAGTDKKAEKGGYGSVAKDEKKASFEEIPHCSICLGEYEEGEELVKLPCRHVYHEECITSWTANHVKCPLCNFDLESASGETSSLS